MILKGEIQNNNGNILYPHTSTDVVFDNDGNRISDTIDILSEKVKIITYYTVKNIDPNFNVDTDLLTIINAMSPYSSLQCDILNNTNSQYPNNYGHLIVNKMLNSEFVYINFAPLGVNVNGDVRKFIRFTSKRGIPQEVYLTDWIEVSTTKKTGILSEDLKNEWKLYGGDFVVRMTCTGGIAKFSGLIKGGISAQNTVFLTIPNHMPAPASASICELYDSHKNLVRALVSKSRSVSIYGENWNESTFINLENLQYMY